MFLVRLTRVIKAPVEKPWSQLLYVTWKKIPLFTPPSSVVHIELWITQWQPCKDKQSVGQANPATKHTARTVGNGTFAFLEQSWAGLVSQVMFWEKDIQGFSEASGYISICGLFSQVYPLSSTHIPSSFLSFIRAYHLVADHTISAMTERTIT